MLGKRFIILTVIALSSALVAVLVAGCGGAGEGASTVTTVPASSGADVAYAKAELDKIRSLPTFKAPGPAFDAKKLMEGKKILGIPASSANPFTKTIEDGIKPIAKEVGFEFMEWENQAQPAQWVQGVEYGINQKYDLIELLSGADPRVLGPQIDAAKAAGIKVISTHVSGFEQTIPSVDENLAIDYRKAGRLLADWVIWKTGGKANVLVLSSDEIQSSASMIGGIKDEFATKGGAGCKQTFVNVSLPDWSTKIQQSVQSAIIKDPTLNYVIPIYDSMSQFVVPAIETTHSSDQVKIVTFNGTPFVLGLLQQGKVEMDIGENLDWVSHAIADDEMRLLGGLPWVKNENIPFYLWDSSNVANAGNPPRQSTGYGDAYKAGYDQLWGLSQK